MLMISGAPPASRNLSSCTAHCNCCHHAEVFTCVQVRASSLSFQPASKLAVLQSCALACGQLLWNVYACSGLRIVPNAPEVRELCRGVQPDAALIMMPSPT